jgi:hypothetical protein
MDPPPPGFDRVVISCRACGQVDVLEPQADGMTFERLRYTSPRCSKFGSRDIDLKVESVG